MHRDHSGEFVCGYWCLRLKQAIDKWAVYIHVQYFTPFSVVQLYCAVETLLVTCVIFDLPCQVLQYIINKYSLSFKNKGGVEGREGLKESGDLITFFP